MSHTFHHAETGVRIHYNSDLSGNAEITVDGVSRGFVPAAALAAFGRNATLDLVTAQVENLYVAAT